MSIINPLNIKSGYWIYEKYDEKPLYKSGKWIMYFNKEVLFNKWKRAVTLFRRKQLKGIKSMKCSTNIKKENTKSIVFFCEKSDKKENIMKIGKELMDKMEYSKTMYYTTDKQNLMGIKGYLYKIECNFDAFADDSE